MINSINRKIIDVARENFIPIAAVKQLDDVLLQLTLVKNGIAFDVTGQTLSLRCRKQNNKTEELSNTSTDTPITFNKNEVDIKLRNSMFNTVGVVKFELNIQDSTGAMTTASFFITVVALELDDDAVTSSEQYSVLQELINNFDSSPIGEVVAARNGHATLGERLDGVDSQLEDIENLTSDNTASENLSVIQNKINTNNVIDLKGVKNEYEISDSIQIKNNTTLKVSSNVTIKNNINASGNIVKKSTEITDRVQNVSIIGGTYDYNLLSASGNNNHAIFFHKADNIKLEDMTILNARKYAFLLADINRATIRDIKLNTSSDGIHFQPPLKDIYVNNISGTTGDDMLAITIGDYSSYNTSSGNVEDFYASNLYPENTMTVLKLCGQENYKFKRVVVENVAGSTFHEGFYFRVDGDILNDFTADYIRLSNIKLQTGGDDYPLLKLWTNTQMNINTLILEDVEHDGSLFYITGTGTWSINIKNLHLKNIKNIISNTSTILKYNGFIGTNVTIENLYIDNIELNSDEILSTVYECFIENRGTIKNLYINGGKVKFPVNQYALIRNINGTINNLNLNSYYQYQGACVYYQNAKTYTGYIRINNVNLDEVWEAFNVNADTIFTLASTTTSRNGATFRTSNSTGTYKITGELINTANKNVSCIAGASVGNIYVDGNINADIEKVKGIAIGARCYNTNNDVYTGRGYYTYNNWSWEKEANKNVVRYVTSDYTIGKYDSFIKANGTITITLPNSSPIMGKDFVIFNISTKDTVTLNDSSGASVATIPPSTRKDIVSGGSSWHIF